MIQVDRHETSASVTRVFACAADVERWPEWLAHYRWVRFLERRPDGGLVEMAAWRPFGPLRWPTWWVSEMTLDRTAPAVRYRHVRGITRGMDVEWTFAPEGERVAVTVTHRWDGPPWPGLRRAAAGLVIGPLFVHAIAQRTLAGIARVAEAGAGR
ncbi:MAG TPA: SRPBCC family protein [Gemmatimonadales bacterium]|nr:SRPBCC family protein [Gemmatimonadales bacterium]